MPLPLAYPFKTGQSVKKNLFFIAGPCVIESERLCLDIAETLTALAAREHTVIIFKASYDKANRTSRSSFRGLGMKKGLAILEKVKSRTGLPILTDIHSPAEAKEAAGVADVLQIPAFLCRQTDLLVAAAKTGKFVNVKKGQFMAPHDMKYSLEKAGKKAWLTERGTVFGYNRLVVDFSGHPRTEELRRARDFRRHPQRADAGRRQGTLIRKPRPCNAARPRGRVHGRRRTFLRNSPAPGQGALRRGQYDSGEGVCKERAAVGGVVRENEGLGIGAWQIQFFFIAVDSVAHSQIKKTAALYRAAVISYQTASLYSTTTLACLALPPYSSLAMNVPLVNFAAAGS